MNRLNKNYKTAFFKGWYFKHQNRGRTVCFIVGINIDKNKNRSAFIQAATDFGSYNIGYDFHDFMADDKALKIKIKNNEFSKNGIKVDIEDKEIKIKGEISYSGFKAVKNIMGPFKYFPMQCNHGIVSMSHDIFGTLNINGQDIDFNGGCGYIEKDRGSSFPKRYLWAQYNDFSTKDTSIMAAAGDISFLGMVFKGCICVVWHKNKEYRMTTYNGVRILKCDKTGVIIKQGKYMLRAQIFKNNFLPLYAPTFGKMTKIIEESPASRARFGFYINNEIVFDKQSDGAGFEFVM